MTAQTAPRWNLTNVYPSLSSKEYNADCEKVESFISDMESLMEKAAAFSGQEDASTLGALAQEMIACYNAILLVGGTIRAYIESFVSTDSYNQEALRKES